MQWSKEKNLKKRLKKKERKKNMCIEKKKRNEEDKKRNGKALWLYFFNKKSLTWITTQLFVCA